MAPTVHLGPRKRLELHNHAVSKRISSLFSELSCSEELQKTFIESPIEVIGQEVLGINYTKEQASAVNKFIFSVLASDKLQKWAAEYNKANSDKKVTPEQARADVAEALIKYGDPSIMSGLLESLAIGALIPGVASDSALIVKADSVAVGNWFVYKVSGIVFGDDNIVLPAEQVQVIAAQILAQAQQLQAAGELR